LLKFSAVKAIQFLKDVRFELSKVTWPKREEVIKLTLTVLLISAIVGAYVGGLDFIFTKLLELVIAR
jgi:preprotein translocase subunit SecE